MPCDAGWTRAPRSTRVGTPFRECRCAAKDGAADAGTRVSSEAPIARLFVSSRSVPFFVFRNGADADGHKNVVWSWNLSLHRGKNESKNQGLCFTTSSLRFVTRRSRRLQIFGTSKDPSSTVGNKGRVPLSQISCSFAAFSVFTAPGRDDSALRLGAVALRSSRGAARC